MREQYERFCEALKASGEYSTECDKCPIQKECEQWGNTLTDEEQLTAPCCEEILFLYVMTGEKPRGENDDKG